MKWNHPFPCTFPVLSLYFTWSWSIKFTAILCRSCYWFCLYQSTWKEHYGLRGVAARRSIVTRQHPHPHPKSRNGCMHIGAQHVGIQRSAVPFAVCTVYEWSLPSGNYASRWLSDQPTIPLGRHSPFDDSDTATGYGAVSMNHILSCPLTSCTNWAHGCPKCFLPMWEIIISTACTVGFAKRRPSAINRYLVCKYDIVPLVQHYNTTVEVVEQPYNSGNDNPQPFHAYWYFCRPLELSTPPSLSHRFYSDFTVVVQWFVSFLASLHFIVTAFFFLSDTLGGGDVAYRHTMYCTSGTSGSRTPFTWQL